MAGWCQRVGAVGRWVSLAVIGLGLAVPAAALAQINGPALTLQLQVQPQGNDKFHSAEFRLWVPEIKGPLRGVIIRQHGCGRKGLDHADDVQWQALALKTSLRLAGGRTSCLPTNARIGSSRRAGPSGRCW
jgi:poly(3-hydroxybutyrate) depolymerase